MRATRLRGVESRCGVKSFPAHCAGLNYFAPAGLKTAAGECTPLRCVTQCPSPCVNRSNLDGPSSCSPGFRVVSMLATDSGRWPGFGRAAFPEAWPSRKKKAPGVAGEQFVCFPIFCASNRSFGLCPKARELAENLAVIEAATGCRGEI